MNVEQDRLSRRQILEEVRPLGSRRTIYYGHVPPAYDQQPFEGCPRAALRASQSDRNNIPYIAPPFLRSAPDRHHLAVEDILRGSSWKRSGKVLAY